MIDAILFEYEQCFEQLSQIVSDLMYVENREECDEGVETKVLCNNVNFLIRQEQIY